MDPRFQQYPACLSLGMPDGLGCGGTVIVNSNRQLLLGGDLLGRRLRQLFRGLKSFTERGIVLDIPTLLLAKYALV